MSSALLGRKPVDSFLASAWSSAAVLGGVLITSAVLPLPGSDGRILRLPSICAFYDITGLPCPGCGLTRSFVSFAHGQFYEAFRWHLLGPPLWLAFALLFARAVLTIIQKRPIFPLTAQQINRTSLVAVALFVFYGAVRIAWLTTLHRHFSGT